MKSTIISQMKFFFALCIIVAFIPKAFGQAITQLEVETRLDEWGTGLTDISQLVIDKDPLLDIFNEADSFVDTFYNYDNGANVVSFKPTVTIDIPVRETKAGALSYFVGGNPLFPEDTGFALKKWTTVTHDILSFSNRQTDTAIVQTQTTITNVDGVVVKPYFSMVWVKVPISPVPAQGPLYTLKLDLHHSSLPYVAPTSITEAEIKKALDDWGKGLVSISEAKAKGQDYVAVATTMINDAYNYQKGIVLFKPTLTAEIPFRTTFNGALSYFVGGNSVYPEDKGFALNPFKAVSYVIEGIVYDGDRAIVQAKMVLTLSDGSALYPFFSMGFVKDDTGKLKIDLHHSSVVSKSGTSAADTKAEEEEKMAIGYSMAAIIIAIISFLVIIAFTIGYMVKSARKQKLAEEHDDLVPLGSHEGQSV